jgi:hypothetical protein
MKTARSVLGVAALAIVAWSSSALAQLPAGNHYLCYKTRDVKVPAKFVSISDISVADSAVGNFNCVAKKPAFLCNPVDKEGSGVADPSLNQCCYKVKCDPNKIPTQFDVTDQFGSLRLETGKAFLLCNPCSKASVP